MKKIMYTKRNNFFYNGIGYKHKNIILKCINK